MRSAGRSALASEWHSDDTVWYDLLAFSRPGHWLIWLGYPCIRRLQRRFALASLAAMVRAVGAQLGCPYDASVTDLHHDSEWPKVADTMSEVLPVMHSVPSSGWCNTHLLYLIPTTRTRWLMPSAIYRLP
jgi:hypothetical protein